MPVTLTLVQKLGKGLQHFNELRVCIATLLQRVQFLEDFEELVGPGAEALLLI